MSHIKTAHKVYMCMCKKVFVTGLQLTIHLRECLTPFKELALLKVQETEPANAIEPHGESACSLCPMNVRCRDLMSHMADKHEMAPKKIVCCICSEKCETIPNFIQHMRTQHILIKCNCMKSYKNFELFTKHALQCIANYTLVGPTTID
jgi:hypothetical protein